MKKLLKRCFIGLVLIFTISEVLSNLIHLYVIRYDKKHPEDLERFAAIREKYNF